MKKLIIANWKMNPVTFEDADKLAGAVLKAARSVKNVDTVLCPPFVWLECLTGKYGKNIFFGSQDVFWEERGAFTGEISAAMLKSMGIRYTIIGHSERRRHLGETDEMVNKKVRMALGKKLKVILCIGETYDEHKRGQTRSVLGRQLRKDLRGIKKISLQSLIIAYEPVWAIGTGLPETPQNAQRVAHFIRSKFSRIVPVKTARGVKIIYGGSVNSQNIAGYLAMPDISGALIGGASLDATEFSRIVTIAGND